MQAREFGIGRCDGRGQRQPCLGLVGTRRVGFGCGGSQRRAIPAPQIQIPREIQGRTTIVVPALRRQRARRDVVVALLLLGDGRVRVDLGFRGGVRGLDHGLRALQSSHGHGDARRSCERFVHERIELRIAIGLPPRIGRPLRGRPRERTLARILVAGLSGAWTVRDGKPAQAPSISVPTRIARRVARNGTDRGARMTLRRDERVHRRIS